MKGQRLSCLTAIEGRACDKPNAGGTADADFNAQLYQLAYDLGINRTNGLCVVLLKCP